MPTILKIRNWRVVICTNDHRPPHVHVIGTKEHARFELLCDLKRVRLMSTIHFSVGQLALIERQLIINLVQLCSEWGRIHGH